MERRLHGRYEEQFEAEEGRLELLIDEDSDGSLLLRVPDRVQSLDISIRAGRYSGARILIIRDSRTELKLTIEADVHKDARLHAGLMDLQEGHLDLQADIYLKEEGATAQLYTGELISRRIRKKNAMNVINEVQHTYGTMHNFAVLQDEADYEMVAAGKIVNGAFGSESHQETRVLTLGSGHRTKVLPILYIDENDVKASHAMTVGQPDADQLYYLESRGLSRMQSMSLLSIGYFMPVISLAGSEEVRQKLREELERKAGLYGHQK